MAKIPAIAGAGAVTPATLITPDGYEPPPKSQTARFKRWDAKKAGNMPPQMGGMTIPARCDRI
jgi:hypothetical protein